MTTRMHHAGFDAVPHRLRRRLEGQIDLLGDGQRIHVGSQGHDRSRPAAAKHADDTRGGDAGRHLEAKLA
jgi:hypothetical protein